MPDRLTKAWLIIRFGKIRLNLIVELSRVYKMVFLTGFNCACLQLKLNKKCNFHANFPSICRFNGLET